MKDIYGNIPVSTFCRLFGKSRQAWYDIRGRAEEEVLQEQLMVELVQQIRIKLPRIGGIKLLSMLSDQFAAHHIQVGRDAFFAILRKYDLLIQPRRRYAITTQSHHHYRRWPDLVNRKTASRVEEIWVSDITYLQTQSGFIYLSLITDAFSRKIVGYHLSQSLKASGCIRALNKALKGRMYPNHPLVHHSDRGIQYCCDAYVEILQKNSISISMTQSGSPYDNAIAERVNGILKSEFNLWRVFLSYSDAIEPVHKAILNYNTFRPHFSCNLKTPEQTHCRESENTLNSVF